MKNLTLQLCLRVTTIYIYIYIYRPTHKHRFKKFSFTPSTHCKISSTIQVSFDPSPLDFHVRGNMTNMVYNYFSEISDAKRRVNDAAVLSKLSLSIVERFRMCIQADGHSEHLLN
jgi:hypothetical protein